MAATSSCLGTVRRMMSRATGTIMAPPAPCSERAATSSASEFALPHHTDATVNTAIAVVNTRRAP
jgi:hypothetical protein